jgi:hypothetical protein
LAAVPLRALEPGLLAALPEAAFLRGDVFRAAPLVLLRVDFEVGFLAGIVVA